MAARRRLAILATAVLASCALPEDLADGATDAASIRCEPSATWVQPEAALARPDGVHLSIENTTDRHVSLYYRIGEDVHPIGEVEVGETDRAVTAGPGSWHLICMAPNSYPAEGDAWAALEVVDPDGVWVSDVLACERITGSHPDYREDFEGGTPRGQEGDPVELARESITGAGFPVLADDVLEPAGYPEAEPVLVRVVRDGRIVAVGSWQPDGRGGWIDRGAEYCDEAHASGEEPASA